MRSASATTADFSLCAAWRDECFFVEAQNNKKTYGVQIYPETSRDLGKAVCLTESKRSSAE
jgi:hypothetical protein